MKRDLRMSKHQLFVALDQIILAIADTLLSETRPSDVM